MAIRPEVHAALDPVWDRATPSSVETVRLDFKEDAPTDKESYRIALEAALCLANTAGGAVVLGLDDDVPGPNAFVGTRLDATRVKKYIHDNSLLVVGWIR